MTVSVDIKVMDSFALVVKMLIAAEDGLSLSIEFKTFFIRFRLVVFFKHKWTS